MIAVIGAGLAGLTAARTLQATGQTCVVLEASDAVGGRVRTDRRGGYLLDRGFQVILDSYPTLRNHVDLAALDVQAFDSGALLWDRGRFWKIRNPLRHPMSALESALAGAFSNADKARLVKLAALAMTRSDQAWLDSCGRRDDLETLALLRRHGISPNAIERFLRPFFGGVFLDNSLSASGSLFFYYLKKFATGRAVVPSGGMGALSAHLARGLTDVRLLSPVSGFQVTKGRVEKVHLAEGSSVDVEGVILATDLQAARALIPTDSPAPAFASVWTVFFEAEESLYSDRLIVLPAGARRVVRHFVQITNVAPGYSQTGRPLLMATILNPGTRHAVALASVAEREIKEVFPNASLELVDIHRVDRAVPLQPPSYFQAPRAKSPFANLVIAGDGIHSSSIEAAMHSGERAALALRPFQKSQGERASRPF